ncbi:MAG TPA: amidohydrolase family protein [Xanthobacteraceae bacterium]|jgi:cytosine/adenosine deaminase-related metal-dependent hydrolase|nr:amidohydrolase family protein [Xanthobacteraceae bacterium]
MKLMSRRHLLGSVAVLAAAAASGRVGHAATSSGTSALPARGTFVIRNAYVMTMDEAGDLSDADVHVANGAIVAVGQSLKAPGASTIDGRGMIVLPGLIETHWHMWNTLLRSMSGDKPETGYFKTTALLGQKFEAGDMYQGTRLACAEAINNGITHVHDWCHNIRGPAYADADLKSLRESGLRARFSYGWSQAMPNGQVMDLADLKRLREDWSKISPDGLITLGFAWRGQGGNNPATAIPPEVYKAEIEAARQLGLPITVHASGSRPVVGQIDGIAKAGLLKSDMQIVHADKAAPDEIKAVADAGASLSISPFTELRIGFGLPQTAKFLEAGIPVGLSVDTVELSGNADMFGIMKITQNVENGISENEFKLTARRVLQLATSEGARSMGIGDKTGSLKPGKRADLIMVDTRGINLGVFGDPAHMLVTAAEPANVDTVMVDGRILKRHGKLTALDADAIVADAAAANAALRKRANWS